MREVGGDGGHGGDVEGGEEEGGGIQSWYHGESSFTLMEKAIFDGVSINNSPSIPGNLMNSKTEYKQGQVARVVLVRGLGQ